MSSAPPAGNFTDTGNATVSSGAWDFLGPLQDMDFLWLELQLVGSAMGIIYLGAHASLRRPPSAAPPKDKKTGKTKKEDDNFTQGLELGDAIMFPLMAGCVLVGLYYLIQYLKDPAILTTILKYYMSTVSVASMVTLYAHGMDLVTSFVFPKYWRGRDGRLRKAVQGEQKAVTCDDAGNVVDQQTESNPLPWILGIFAPTANSKAFAWKLRNLLTRNWLFRIYLRGAGEEKTTIKFVTVLAIPVSAITAFFYFTTNLPFLSNMLGYGMCYCSLLILSPTDLMIGSLVLVGLFFYDIVMVFYT